LKKIIPVSVFVATLAVGRLLDKAHAQSPEPAETAPAPQAPDTVVAPIEGLAPAEPAPAPATEQTAPPVSAARASMRITSRSGMTALVKPLNSEPVDFDFKDADLLGILRTFATKVDRNIIAAPGVGGKVNLRLRGVPFDDAFRILLDQMGLVAIQKTAGVIEIIRSSQMPFLVEIFPLKYRFAQDMQKTVVETLKGEERDNTVVSVDIASNALLVTSTNDVLHKVKQILGELDIESPQISVKARLIEVQAGSNFNWGVSWAASTKFDTGGQTRTMKDMTNYTVDGAGQIITANAPTFFPTGGILDVSTVMNKTRVYALLNMLMTDTRNKTISEPTILTGNNKSAKIHVGQNLPVRTSQVTQTATTQSIQYIPEGVDLEVTPVVSPGSDIISFRIRVSVSELVGFQDNNPITTERVATTEVSVESGSTVVIGGLIKEKNIDVDSGIPLLKDIPLLGYLFKNKRKSTEKTELLIFITPELVAKTAKL
jgi:type II secretory pathway component GspD/PulD (secretin)